MEHKQLNGVLALVVPAHSKTAAYPSSRHVQAQDAARLHDKYALQCAKHHMAGILNKSTPGGLARGTNLSISLRACLPSCLRQGNDFT